MGLSKADTIVKLVDSTLHPRDWTEDLRREKTVGAIEIIESKPRKQAKGWIYYTLRVRVNPNTQLIAMALIEG
jgi:type I restriction enzyme, R subunit